MFDVGESKDAYLKELSIISLTVDQSELNWFPRCSGVEQTVYLKRVTDCCVTFVYHVHCVWTWSPWRTTSSDRRTPIMVSLCNLSTIDCWATVSNLFNWVLIRGKQRARAAVSTAIKNHYGSVVYSPISYCMVITIGPSCDTHGFCVLCVRLRWSTSLTVRCINYLFYFKVSILAASLD